MHFPGKDNADLRTNNNKIKTANGKRPFVSKAADRDLFMQTNQQDIELLQIRLVRESEAKCFIIL